MSPSWPHPGLNPAMWGAPVAKGCPIVTRMSLTRFPRTENLQVMHQTPFQRRRRERPTMHLKRTLALAATLALTLPLAACESSDSSSSSGGSADFGDCKVTSKKGSISLKPVKAGTLTVETTLPAQGWWNGTTPTSIKSGYEYCFAANLANAGGLTSVTVKNVSFDQLVAGRTNDYDIALAEISITPEREKVVDFSVPY